jgi:nitrite reductase/ring-hydroxylating ferredoxin subunit
MVDVGAEAEFEHSVPRLFVIAGKEVGVVRWGDRYFAMRNHCPDQGGPLCAGPVRAPLSAGPVGDHVQLSEEEGRPVIACPWHHYEFDLQTGHEIRGGRRAITYQVELDGGRVYVRTGVRPASGSNPAEEL